MILKRISELIPQACRCLFLRLSPRMYADTGAKSLLISLFSGQSSTSVTSTPRPPNTILCREKNRWRSSILLNPERILTRRNSNIFMLFPMVTSSLGYTNPSAPLLKIFHLFHPLPKWRNVDPEHRVQKAFRTRQSYCRSTVDTANNR